MKHSDWECQSRNNFRECKSPSCFEFGRVNLFAAQLKLKLSEDTGNFGIIWRHVERNMEVCRTNKWYTNEILCTNSIQFYLFRMKEADVEDRLTSCVLPVCTDPKRIQAQSVQQIEPTVKKIYRHLFTSAFILIQWHKIAVQKKVFTWRHLGNDASVASGVDE